MPATATDKPKSVAWKLWVPGVVTPIACFLADYAAGEFLLSFAPAALLCLAGIGIGALLLSGAQPLGIGGLVAVGPMWIVGGLTLALGIPLAAISIWAMNSSFFAMLAGFIGALVICANRAAVRLVAGGPMWVVGGLAVALGVLLPLPLAGTFGFSLSRISGLQLPFLAMLAGIGIGAFVFCRNRTHGAAAAAAVGPMWIVGGLTLALGAPLAMVSIWGLDFSFGMLFLLWALLGLTPLWTGATYTRQAYVLTKHQAVARGALKTGMAAVAGAVTATLMVIGAHLIDSRVVATRLAALETKELKALQAALHSLSAYPLCGRRRCRRLVCNQWIRQSRLRQIDGRQRLLLHCFLGFCRPDLVLWWT